MDDIDMKDEDEVAIRRVSKAQKKSPVKDIYGEDESSQEVTTVKRKLRTKKRALV